MPKMLEKNQKENKEPLVTVLWFRHGLRLHDNPALLEALSKCTEFYAIFIFDGESAGTEVIGYNRMKFLLEALNDINNQLEAINGRLYILNGKPISIFKRLHEEIGLKRICVEHDCESIWRTRDDSVKTLCEDIGIEWVEKVSRTLWDPKVVIETNEGVPPMTYQMFLKTVEVIGPPPRPVQHPDWTDVKFGKLPQILFEEFGVFSLMPSPETFGLVNKSKEARQIIHWIGGERHALNGLANRLKVEENAFRNGIYLPNQAYPDLVGPPTSLSAALKFGCLSVRRFYWDVLDIFNKVRGGNCFYNESIIGQLIWREYFYTMSFDNPFYGEMERNPICLDISWHEDQVNFKKWKKGMTGYPFIDAAMRQLVQEGWIHHAARNAVACFLTRGDLWISWELGLAFFLYHLLDADWSICAGNWMWVSSSAFEKLLDCSQCVSPVCYGRRLDPLGAYIKRYVPELSGIPTEYIHEPWKAPLEVQQSCNCIIGCNYPEQIVDHKMVSVRNQKYMEDIRNRLMNPFPQHCCPSNEEEARQFLLLAEQDHIH